jgi:cyanophycinase
MSMGSLIIIGGHEDKHGERRILREVAARVGERKMVIAAVASRHPETMRKMYEAIFRDLGVKHIDFLRVEARDHALAGADVLDESTAAVFFTGGDQLRITTLLGGSPVSRRIREIYEAGGLIVGTSAGASVLGETMIVRGDGGESYRIGSGANMAPGLGLLPGVIIDQHFAQRGRIGRLVGAVTHNPRILGLGIDEDTAVIVDNSGCLVIGAGGVYVVDARSMTYSNLAEEEENCALTAVGLTLHILSQGDRLDLLTRTVVAQPAERADRPIGSVGSRIPVD